LYNLDQDLYHTSPSYHDFADWLNNDSWPGKLKKGIDDDIGDALRPLYHSTDWITNPQRSFPADPRATQALEQARARLLSRDTSVESSGGDFGTEPEPCPQTQGSGNGGKPPDKPKAPAPGRDDRPNRHHRLPQQFKDFFDWKGLNIEDYTRELPESQHIGAPDGIHPRGYNGDWEDWIQQNGDRATREDILDFLHQLEQKYGLSPM